MGFGFGGVLALHLAPGDDRVAGVACLGTPADLAPLVRDPADLLARCRRTGVITTPGFPASIEAWAKELSVLHPAEDAALSKGRPLLWSTGPTTPTSPSPAPAPWPTPPPGPPSCTSCSARATGCGPTPG